MDHLPEENKLCLLGICQTMWKNRRAWKKIFSRSAATASTGSTSLFILLIVRVRIHGADRAVRIVVDFCVFHATLVVKPLGERTVMIEQIPFLPHLYDGVVSRPPDNRCKKLPFIDKWAIGCLPYRIDQIMCVSCGIG